MNIHETIKAVMQALDGADRLARICQDSEGLAVEQIRAMAVKTAAELSIDIAHARAGLNGTRVPANQRAAS